MAASLKDYNPRVISSTNHQEYYSNNQTYLRVVGYILVIILPKRTKEMITKWTLKLVALQIATITPEEVNKLMRP